MSAPNHWCPRFNHFWHLGWCVRCGKRKKQAAKREVF